MITLCTSCTYYVRKDSELSDECHHDAAVTGCVRQLSYYSCLAMRAGICGKGAEHFEQRELLEEEVITWGIPNETNK